MIKKLTITGMTCNNCVRHTKEALEDVEGVIKVDVDLQSGTAVVECNDTVSEDALKNTVEEEGYSVTSIL